MNVPVPWHARSLSERDADEIAESIGEGGDHGQLFLTEDDEGAVVGLCVREAKLSLRVPPALLLKLARRCLEVSVPSSDTHLGDLAG
jgi:hypothetical protein